MKIQVQVLNAQDVTAAIMHDLETAIERALNRYGELVTERARDHISIPVEYENGRIIRSKPGEYPRTETGKLMDGVKSRVGYQGGTYSMVVTSDREGTPEAPRRLIYTLSRLNWLADAMNEVVDADMPEGFIKSLSTK